jgi:hypothetical protein
MCKVALLLCLSASLAQQIEDDDGHGPIIEGTMSPIQDGRVPLITLEGNITVYRTVSHAHDTSVYQDQGAQCSDSVDGCEGAKCGDSRSGSGFPLVMVAGEVVNLKRVGVYKMQYTCMNSVGTYAVPVERKIVVTGAVHQSCKDVQLTGLPSSAPQASRMGRYRMESLDHGRPLYKQVNGTNYLYFRSQFPEPCWVVDAFSQDDVRGLRLTVPAQSISPLPVEGVASSPWNRLTSDKHSSLIDEDYKWVADDRIKIGCVKKQNKLIWYPHFKVKHKAKVYDIEPAAMKKKDLAFELQDRDALYGAAEKLERALVNTTHPVACKEHVAYGHWSTGCTRTCGPSAQRLRQKAIVKCKGNKPTTAFVKEHRLCKVRACNFGEKPAVRHPEVPDVGTYY